VGFSAVLFALKYVLNATSPGSSVVGGIAVPTRWAAWVELVLISLVTPNASFLGHLCGAWVY
jgi:rhomboid domain-containing protein 1